MHKLLINLLSSGLIVLGLHWGITMGVMPEEWQTNRIFIYDPILFFLSFLIIGISVRVSRSDPDKTGLYYSYMTIAKLIILASVFLVESQIQQDNSKLIIIGHFIVPAFIFIALETILVRNLLQTGE